ncbi:hypothetical protein BJY04DRAFT_200805 [Aspergillus karnatakaensis]|uniref:uncharacterized protein n=1 Tax=Aspergillus karnatakaensis TaxID=1810916 RepID=UPI003CCCD753
MSQNSMDDAMASALGHFSTICANLKRIGHHKASNEIGKLANQIVAVYWAVSDNNPTDTSTTDDTTTSSSQPRAVTHQPSLRHAAQEQVADTSNKVSAKQAETEAIESKAFQPLPAPTQAPAQPDSWAQVVGAESHASHSLPPPKPAQSSIWSAGANTRAPILPQSAAYSLTPGVSPTSLSFSSGPANNTNTVTSGAPSSAPVELPEEKAGVIRISGPVTKDRINSITSRIHEGPLFEVRIETNQRARLVFQYLAHAHAFVKSNEDMIPVLGHGRFGAGYHVELVEILNWHEDLHRMNQPSRERRRLSFARKRLFNEGVSPDRWKSDIRRIAGPGNIDLLWVFNSGNATAVFTSTIVARRVLEAFTRWAEAGGAYSELSVTFSSDPCEKPLTLVRENNRLYQGLSGYIPRRSTR